jgi:hypothetical protein
MRGYKDLSEEEQKLVKTYIFDTNKEIAGRGLLGFDVKKLSPSKKTKKEFDEQFTGHPLCGCVGCMQLANIFIDKSPDVWEEIIVESVKDLQTVKVK